MNEAEETQPETPVASKPRVAIAGIHIESSTFTPYLSGESDFDVRRGDRMMQRYPWTQTAWGESVTWLPILHARALPGGVVEREAYEGWKKEILEGLKELGEEAPLDGFFFDIHGAMSVEGLDDAEGDLILAIRDVIGSDPLVSTSMDLHGNISPALFEGADLLTCYRTAPHVDTEETRERAAHLLVERLQSGRGKPAKAVAHVPILLPGEKTSTRDEPAKSLYQRLPEIGSLPGVLDAAIWVGFAWADQPRSKAAIVVTGDDPEEVQSQALALANAMWEVRDQFEFVAPSAPLDEVLEWAKSANRPTLISDTGDNPGAGGADDVTFTLDGLLDWQPVVAGDLDVLVASIVDHEVAAQAHAAGLGASFETVVGGKIDSRDPGPLPLQARVLDLSESSRGGLVATLRVSRAGSEAAANAGDGVTLIVTSNRDQYASLDQYFAAGVDPRTFDVVAVKIGYLEPDLYELAADWMMALTPGGVDQDLPRLGHSAIDRPMHPFDADLDQTGPTVRLVVPQQD